MPTCIETVAQFLAGAGVRRIYGVPGEGASLDLLEACRERDIGFVLASDEASAAIMAATEGEILGRPGVCLTGPGAGVAAGARGLAQAMADRAPMLICTDRSSYARLCLGEHRSLDHLRVLRGVVKGGHTLTASRAERLLAAVWARASAPPAGPMHLDIPSDEAGRPARVRGVRAALSSPRSPSPTAIRAAARLLTRRGRAAVVAGLGCRADRSARALRELVAHLGSPVLTTPKAKGVIPEDHPLAAGVFTGGRLDGSFLQRADCILLVGVDPAELLALPWGTERPVVALSEYRLGPRPFRAAMEVVADLAESLTGLRAALPPAGEWGLANWARQAAAFRSEVRGRLAAALRGGSGLQPHRIVAVARETLPRTARAVVDSGAHAMAVAAFWESYEPRQYGCSAVLAASGYALPAAVAAGLADPAGPVVAFVGDGGLLASLGALATAAHHRLPLVVIVFADESLNLVRVLQERKRHALEGVALPTIGVPSLAEGLGALGIVVETEEALAAALRDAMAAGAPAVIAARTQPAGYRRMLEALWGPPPPG